MKTRILLLFFIIGFTSAAFTQSWTGAVDSDWNNPANWSSPPGDGGVLVIDPANYTGAMAWPEVTGASDFTPAELLMQGGAQLTITGALEVTDHVYIKGINSWLFISGALAVTGEQAALTLEEQAAMNVTGGTLEVENMVEIRLGGNAAFYTTSSLEAGKILISGGQADISSDLYLNSGTISTDTLRFTNETAEFTPRFRLAGGELNIASNLSWMSTAPDGGKGSFRQTGGVVNMAGTLGNAMPSTMNIKMEIMLTAALSGGIFYNSASPVHLAEGDSLMMTNDGVWYETGTVTWQNDGVLLSDGWGLYRSGISTLTGTGIYQFGQVVISAGNKIEHVSPRDILVCGDMVINGEFIPHENRVIINSPFSSQVIMGPDDGQSFYDLVIDNHSPAYDTYGGYVSLNPDITIENSMVLQDGIVTLHPTRTLRIAEGATLTGGTDTTFVDGYIEKTGNVAFTFPLGKRSSVGTFLQERYRPLTITAPASASTIVRAGYQFTAPSATVANTPLQSISQLEHWPLSRTGSSDLFGVSVGWDDAAASGLSDCGEISLALLNSNASAWNAVSSAASGLCNGDNAGMLTSTGSLPHIGPVSIGFTTNTVHQQFVSVCNGDSYTVNGNTYETSGVYIDEMEAANGEDSTVITILTVRGPLSVTVGYNPDHLLAFGEGLTFQWIDCDNGNAVIPGETGNYFFPSEAGNYAVIAYSAECDEIDTSDCIAMEFAGLDESEPFQLQVYPNPVASGGQLMLQVAGEVVLLEARGLDGRIIVPAVKPIPDNDKIVFDLPQLPEGVYLLVVMNAAGQQAVTRFMVTN